MPMTDPIGDMLTRIRNAQSARLKSVKIPHSRLKFDMAKIMEREGYVSSVRTENDGIKGEIIVLLKYTAGVPTIRALKRISKPGRRLYAKANELPRVLSDIGIAIVSTPSGLMTNKEARKRRLGGEVLCEIF
ncbi:MAG: 30S ribosomal protein S8 [Patescibacteria group bacterium]